MKYFELFKKYSFWGAAIVIITATVFNMSNRTVRGELEIVSINDELEKSHNQLEDSVFENQEIQEPEEKSNNEEKPVVIALSFHGNSTADNSKYLASDVNTIVNARGEISEVVVELESLGGLVHEYGYAASQLERIKDKNIPLTVCVDKAAASGGYMMATVADLIVAAPFAVIGSIGVVAEVPNFNKLLKKYDIDFDVITAGEHKRTLTLLGENTEAGRTKFKSDLKKVHDLFKRHIVKYRPNVNIDEIANGDVWYGQDAIHNNLVDKIQTCNQYLYDKTASAQVYKFIRKGLGSDTNTIADSVKAGISEGIKSVITDLIYSEKILF